MSEPVDSPRPETTDALEDEELFLPDDEPSTIDANEEKLRAVEQERDEMRDRYLRKAADFENARRRYHKEKDDLQKYAAEKVLREMVSVLDDLERASAAARTGAESGEAAGLVEGVDMVLRKFTSTLERFGVTGYVSEGQPFDPNLHEAIQRIDDATVPHNMVVREFQRGYRIADRLLRPAMVIVAQGGGAFVPPQTAQPADEPLESLDAMGDDTDKA
jgi:molecular chaperone GrpE